jgi:hypothetical protein
MVELAYDNAGWFAERVIDRFVEMDREQRVHFRRSFESAHERHRSDALPSYVRLIEAVQRRLLRRGLETQEARCLIWTGARVYRDLAARMVPLVSELLRALDAGQIDALEESFAAKNEEFAERYLQGDREARAAARAQRAAARLADWLGGVRVDQEILLLEVSMALPDTAPGWYAYREDRQRGLLRMLRAGPVAATELADYLESWWVWRQAFKTEDARALELAEEGVAVLLVNLEATLDEAQRRTLAARLGRLAAGLGAAAAGDGKSSTLMVAGDPWGCPAGGLAP